MTQPLSILDQGEFQFYVVSEHGIHFKADIPRDEWLNVTKRLSDMIEGATLTREKGLMLLADTLNFGENKFGEEFSQAIDGMRHTLGLTPKTISNAQRIYRLIEPSRRRVGLTLSHYDLIAALSQKEQESLMDEAQTKEMSVSEFRHAVIERHPKTKRGKTRKGGADLKSEEGLQIAAEKIAIWFAENEKGLTAAQLKKWKPLLEPLFKVYRRKWQSGHKR